MVKDLQKSKSKKAKIVFATIVCVAVIVLLLNYVIVPNIKYNQAINLIDSDVVQAYEALIAMEGFRDSNEKASSIYTRYKSEQLKNVGVGECFTFGRYFSDIDKRYDFVYYSEDVEWFVLAKENNKLLVISKYALEYEVYNDEYYDVTWEYSTLRNSLNNYFLKKAFSADEQKMILTTTVPAHKNPDYNTDQGNDTQDKIFVLSVTEAEKYFASDDDRECYGTNYVKKKAQAEELYNGDEFPWWLRTLGEDQKDCAFVNFMGKVCSGGRSIYSHSVFVRPAMWIELSN